MRALLFFLSVCLLFLRLTLGIARLRRMGSRPLSGSPNQLRFRAGRPRFFARVVLDLRARVDFALLFRFAFGWSRSGSSAFPAPRFHSSKVSGEISPLTNNSANFLRCALLLIGIDHLSGKRLLYAAESLVIANHTGRAA